MKKFDKHLFEAAEYGRAVREPMQRQDVEELTSGVVDEARVLVSASDWGILFDAPRVNGIGE
jgi:hypothetical protein